MESCFVLAHAICTLVLFKIMTFVMYYFMFFYSTIQSDTIKRYKKFFIALMVLICGFLSSCFHFQLWLYSGGQEIISKNFCKVVWYFLGFNIFITSIKWLFTNYELLLKLNYAYFVTELINVLMYFRYSSTSTT